MANTKITYAQIINKVMEMPEVVATFSDEEMSKLNDLLKSVSKKSVSKADLEKQKLNEELRAIIVEVLGAIGRPATITEILAKGVEIGVLTNEVSNQKVTYQANQLVSEGVLEKSKDKRTVLFGVVAD